MNKTELKAYSWLQSKGIDAQPNNPMDGSPDLLASDGRWFEVKRLVGNTIMFTPKQIEWLRSNYQNTQILLFRDNDTEPSKIFDAKSVVDVGFYDGIKIHTCGGKICIHVTEGEKVIIKLAAISQNKSESEWLYGIIIEWLRKEVIDGNLGKFIGDKYNQEILNDGGKDG